MIYNDGKVHNDFYDKPAIELEKIAREFSEGNPSLEKALLSMWNKNIKTIACCNGHGEKMPWYLSFRVDNNPYSMHLVDELIEYVLFLKSDNILLDFGTVNGSFVTSIYSDEENILNLIKNTKLQIKENTNSIFLYAKYLNIFAHAKNLDFSYGINGQDMYFSFLEKGTIAVFRKDIPDIGDFIDEIRQTGKLPLALFKCNEESLKELLSIIFPQVEIFRSKKSRF